MAVALLVSAAASAAVVPVPYYGMAPGSALALDQLVEVDDERRFPAEGDVYLTTVSLEPLTAFGVLRGWIDPAVDVVPEGDVVPPTIRPSDFQRHNREMMLTSQQTALLVAFERLGYDVAPQGDGALVAEVVPGSPSAGVLEPGDVVVGVDGEPVALAGELVAAVQGRAPGEEVWLSVQRDGAAPAVDVAVVLGAREGSDEPLLGVALQTRGLRYDLPFDVDIGAERIGGPSAGLAFTLELLDLLTPGELTGGAPIAATGTIGLDGDVGPVGGVPQKTLAVRDAGIELFLVPEQLEGAAREMAGDDLRVEGVATLDEALAVLADAGGERLLAAPAPAGPTA